MEINLNAYRVLYYLVRTCLALFGALMLMGAVVRLLYPDIVYSESQRTLRLNVLLDVTFLIYGSLLLAPFRWLIHRFVFPVAMVAFGCGILWMIYASAGSVTGVIQGRKSLLALPVAVIYVALSLVAPVTLLLRRRTKAR